MKLHTLKPAPGSTKKRKRVGRGDKTAGRGHKGAQSRSGYKRRANFEGGQLPLQRRIPKFGFKNPNRKVFIPLNLDRISKLCENHDLENLTLKDLQKLGVIKSKERVKILNKGEGFAKKISIEAHAFSQSAKSQIEAHGGTAIIIA